MMEIRNETVYTGRDRVHALYFTSFRLTRRLGLWNMVLTLLLALLGAGVLYCRATGIPPFASKPLMLPSLCLGCALIGVGAIFLFFTVLLLVEKKASVSASFVFCDDEIKAISVVNGIRSEIVVKYTDISKVYEFKRYFYVFYNSQQCFSVVKNGFSDEKDILSLREKLRATLGARLIRC
ncbi:MAG: YcxB family protein [Clostridia bacterium]|nr:YcxB family protein [Clostridia bacterium]